LTYLWPISKETIIWPWGQSPTKVITVCDTPPYGHAPTYQISLTYLERNNYLTLRSKDITVRDTPPYGHAPTYQLSLTYLKRQKCYGPDQKILFKNNYLTLRSKVKVPRRSLWYTTHRLMVMHPHAKYHWPISKDKKVMVWTSFAEKKRKRKKKSD
jgi:hypothetical protein